MGVNSFFAKYRSTEDGDVQFQYSYPWLICFVAAYISSFFLSGGSAPQPDLDESYQVVLEYARVHNFQFGKDIVFTFGPLGFLNNWVSLGLFPLQRILFALIWSGFVAWSVTGLAQQMPGWVKFVFLAWFLVYSNIGWLEQHIFLVLIYGCIILMGEVRTKKIATVSFLAIFAVLALIKFTFFMAIAVGVVLCALVQAGNRNLRLSLVIPVCFVSLLLTLWMAEGQDLRNLLVWLRASSEIAGGYTAAMTILPKTSVLVACTIAGFLFVLMLVTLLKTTRLCFRSLGVLLLVTAYVFLTWKHAFVRADGHVIFFIFFLPMASSVIITARFRKNMCRKVQLFAGALLVVIMLLCNWAADFQEPGIMLSKLTDWPRYAAGNARLIMNSVSGNWADCFAALRSRQQVEDEAGLPVARGLVGRGTVDVLNYRQSVALVNNLNYRPRPVIQGYSAYTPFLQDMNLSWYRSARRPDYLLFSMESIDNRFPALDDAPLLPYILNNYRPIGDDGDFLVMQFEPPSVEDAEPELVKEQTITFDETLDMSAYRDGLYMMKVDITSTFIGELVKLFYQAPVLHLIVESGGKAVSYRFVPEMTQRGFVFSPILRNNEDVMSLYTGKPVVTADKIQFSASGFDWFLPKKLTVKIYRGTVPTTRREGDL